MSTSVIASNSVNSANYNLIARGRKKENSNNEAFSISKVSHTAREDFEKSIATTFIKGSNGSDLARATAWYANGSTEANPILSIEYSNGKDFTYTDININDIDPSNATDLEMFALCSYGDDQNKGVKSTFGTFQAMKTFKTMAIHNNYIDDTTALNDPREAFSTQRTDWQSIIQKVTNLLSQCQDATQYKQGEAMLKLFSDRLDRNMSDPLTMKQKALQVERLHILDISRSIRTELAKSAYL